MLRNTPNTWKIKPDIRFLSYSKKAKLWFLSTL